MSARCDELQSLMKRGCEKSMIENPHGEQRILKNKMVTNRRKGAGKLKPEDITQIQPQKLSLTLRSGRTKFKLSIFFQELFLPLFGFHKIHTASSLRYYGVYLCVGELQSFNLKFKRAEDYPIDLYYLMDLSYSMKDDLENVKNLGTSLMLEMSKITSDFRIGEDFHLGVL